MWQPRGSAPKKQVIQPGDFTRAGLGGGAHDRSVSRVCREPADEAGQHRDAPRRSAKSRCFGCHEGP